MFVLTLFCTGLLGFLLGRMVGMASLLRRRPASHEWVAFAQAPGVRGSGRQRGRPAYPAAPGPVDAPDPPTGRIYLHAPP